jgi:opacity protein-like surface antigen
LVNCYTMKKTFTFCLLALPALFFAQAKGNIEIGFGIGYNGSEYSLQEWGYPSPESTTSLNVHASADYSFSNRWSVKTKLIYDGKGWGQGVLFYRGGEVWRSDVNLHYLTVPVLLNWHFGGQRNWYLNFGPYFGLLMAAGEKRFDADVKEAFRDFDSGIALGIGVKIPLSKSMKLYLEYDGQFGVNSIYKDSNSPETKNTRNALNIGVNFLVR